MKFNVSVTIILVTLSIFLYGCTTHRPAERTNPQFSGGQEALLNFLERNIQYPKIAKDSNVTGKVIVDFIIDDKGQIVNPEISDVHCLNGPSEGCNALQKEALRVIKAMPDWKPGTIKGIPVKVRYALPIVFTL